MLCCWDESFCEGGLNNLKAVADVEMHYPPDRQYMLANIHRFDAYLPSLFIRFDKEMVERATNMKLIATPSTGLDHLDIDAIEAAGIEWTCIKHEIELLDQVTATAEMAWALMLASVRKIPKAYEAAMRGEWARDKFRGRQMSGKTLGLLGVGRLGRMMVDYGRGFRMDVIGCDPNPATRVDDLEYVDFAQLLERADVLSIHIHLTDQNTNLINANAFAKMKDGVVIVNTSRGAIIDEDAFLDALKTGKVGAAGLDVVHGEWRDDLKKHPLIEYAREHDNVVIVPHLGGVTYESQSMSHEFVSDKVAARLPELMTAEARRKD